MEYSLSVAAFIFTVSLAGGAFAQTDTELDWLPADSAFARAAGNDRAVLVFVNSPTCGPCKRMEREVFPETHLLLSRLSLATLNFDDHESRITLGDHSQSPFEWARAFGIDGTPGWVLFRPDGTQILNATGFLDTKAFGILLAYAVTDAYEHASFEEYVETVDG